MEETLQRNYLKGIMQLSGGVELIIKLQQREDIQETRVIIEYSKMDERLGHMIQYMRQYDYHIEAVMEGKNVKLPLEQIYYMESVDGKTFLYDHDNLYESKKSIRSLKEQLVHTTFVQISKSCIMNTARLKGFQAYPNHRLLALMDNGEELVVSRKYKESVKQSIRRVYDA